MSAAFTNPSGATWQTLLNEITLAYSERRQVLGQSAYTPAASRNVQSAAYWQGLQSWLETNCTAFIDHDNGPLTDARDAFLYFTLDSWRAAAGLHQDGFRRKYGPKESLTTAYGHMQAGDAIGPWIFEDLQNGFGALRWKNYSPLKDVWSHYIIWNSDGSIFSEEGPELTANSGSAGSTGGNITYYGGAFGGDVSAYFCTFSGYLSMSRKWTLYHFDKISGMNGSVDVFIKGGPLNLGLAVPPFGDFSDMDGLGLINGKYVLFITLASLDGTSRLIGSQTMFNSGANRHYQSELGFIVKINFTNT